MKTNQHGFSLIEVMIAVIILGLSALFLAKLNAVLLQGTSGAADRQVAIRLAEGVADNLRQIVRNPQLRSLPTSYAGVPGGTPISFGNCDPNTPATKCAIFTNKTTTFTIRRSLLPAAPNLHSSSTPFDAQIDVSWQGSNGQMQNIVTMTSIRPEPAPPWLVATPYVINDLVSFSGRIYKSKTIHSATTGNQPEKVAPPTTDGISTDWQVL
ncbi:prepilin-type N-terminal cleavage/methylation domain-containing protein [Deefgea piscis]|uniref:Prepilin-type N-terminal cleavage/methylation domain-containing protein n=1 Tax=Deefgea piscis TaxID=2739061 RepID=A0A6M8SMA4_9NEIS|nr:prepilin-type N-terminal cleavage/methylation domain-containing protein [Deefgea piscis]QKJ65378.1 prepilin-type N-terminal cleavage/methylation domain-containing protein [Deefgea piscis]